ncbi:helix-turn-helix transcriptional regulator [Streptomyces sp. MAR4 CNY-716]
MARPPGNTRLKSARLAAGYSSQQALADALRVGVRQVKRWESANPPWPQPELQVALTRTLGVSLEALGFTPPAGHDTSHHGRRDPLTGVTNLAAVPKAASQTLQPASVAADFSAVTRSHRHLYWTVAPATLHPAVAAHASLGCALLEETAGATRKAVAAALSETWLLAGRIEFFDLQEPGRADATLLRALQAAGEADDSLLGAAVLAHMAFIPGWSGERDKAVERMTAARTYARRADAAAEFWAWLDAVEAECETRCGNPRNALHLISHAEDVLREPTGVCPEWMDWFGRARLAAFKGNTQLAAGHLPQARSTLLAVLDDLSPDADKQRTVVLGDLAAVEALADKPEEACQYAMQALDQLQVTWYATGMDRIRKVRRQLVPHQHERCVRALDDRLYGWSTTVSALAR